LLSGFARGVSAVWLVGRQGRHQQRVGRQLPQGGNGTTQRVTSQEKEAGKGGSRSCRLWRGGYGPVIGNLSPGDGAQRSDTNPNLDPGELTVSPTKLGV